MYVQDNSGWEALTLYGWGDAAIGDSWPGIQVTGTREINGVTYKYFDLSEHVGKYSNLIFNNNGGGQQIEDGGLYTALIGDIYFSITATSYEKLAQALRCFEFQDGKPFVSCLGTSSFIT